MKSTERALHALRTLLQFELAQVVSEVAAAAQVHEQAQRGVDDLMQRCESSVAALRSAMGQAEINPPLVQAMHRLHTAEHASLLQAHAQLAVAQQRELQARDLLAAARSRQRALDRALQGEKRQQWNRLQAAEMNIADDLWLQSRSYVE